MATVDKGAIPSVWLKQGRNPDIDSGQTEDIWPLGGDINFLTSEDANCDIVSSSANDTGGGTGARTVKIEFLDKSFDYRVEILTLNGTTPVPIPNMIFRLIDIKCLTVGSVGSNDGDIDVRDSGTIVLGRVTTGDGRMIGAYFTLPTKGCLVKVRGSNPKSDADLEYKVLTRENGGLNGEPWLTRDQFAIARHSAGFVEADLSINGLVGARASQPGLPLERGTDVKLRCTSDTNNAVVLGDLQFFLHSRD